MIEVTKVNLQTDIFAETYVYYLIWQGREHSTSFECINLQFIQSRGFRIYGLQDLGDYTEIQIHLWGIHYRYKEIENLCVKDSGLV